MSLIVIGTLVLDHIKKELGIYGFPFMFWLKYKND